MFKASTYAEKAINIFRNKVNKKFIFEQKVACNVDETLETSLYSQSINKTKYFYQGPNRPVFVYMSLFTKIYPRNISQKKLKTKEVKKFYLDEPIDIIADY